MKRTVLCAMLAVLVLAVGGCGQFVLPTPGPDGVLWTPKAKQLAAQESFNATVRTLLLLDDAGAFTPKEWEVVTAMTNMGQKCLDRWKAAILMGETGEEFARDMRLILREMIAEQIAAEERRQKGKKA